MPDRLRAATHAVVDIATQLRRIADHLTTPSADDTDAPTTTADDTQTLRWARRESLLVLLTRVQHGRTLTDDEARTLRHHVETEMRESEAVHERAGQLEELLRIANETSNRSEAERAAAARNAELSDAVTAETKRLLQRRTTTLRQRAERAEAERDQLRATLAEVLDLFSPALSNGQYRFYKATEQPIAPETYLKWRAVLQPPATEEQHGSSGT